MFCGKCGKEISADAKFCPYCGEKNLSAAGGGTAKKQTPPAMGKGMSVGMPEAVLVVCGILHILMYFKLSFGKLSVVSNYISMAASYLDIEIPRKLTCTNAIKIMDIFDQMGVPNADSVHLTLVILCALPIVLSIISILATFFGKSKSLRLVSVICAAVILADYWIINQALTFYTEFGYVMGKGWLLACLVSLIQLVSVVMIYKEKKKL